MQKGNKRRSGKKSDRKIPFAVCVCVCVAGSVIWCGMYVCLLCSSLSPFFIQL